MADAPSAPSSAAARPVSSAAAAQQQLMLLAAKQQLYDLLLSDLERSLGELYTLCEYEAREDWVEGAWSMLIEAGANFGEVRRARAPQTSAPPQAPRRTTAA